MKRIQGRLLGDANDALASGAPAQEAPRVSGGEKWSKFCLRS
jgi:hypothetical protein